MSKKKLICLFIMLLALCNQSYGDQQYYLCGPDEDGCFMDEIQDCACIPYDESHANQPYCLDFEKMTCEPVTYDSHCDSGLIFKDQGHCLATLYQSEAEPPCSITTKTFCLENNVYICDANGNPRNCKK